MYPNCYAPSAPRGRARTLGGYPDAWRGLGRGLGQGPQPVLNPPAVSGYAPGTTFQVVMPQGTTFLSIEVLTGNVTVNGQGGTYGGGGATIMVNYLGASEYPTPEQTAFSLFDAGTTPTPPPTPPPAPSPSTTPTTTSSSSTALVVGGSVAGAGLLAGLIYLLA